MTLSEWNMKYGVDVKCRGLCGPSVNRGQIPTTGLAVWELFHLTDFVVSSYDAANFNLWPGTPPVRP